MRRLFGLSLIILLLTAALASAQDNPPLPAAELDGEPLVVFPQHIATAEWRPVELEPIDGPPIPLSPEELPAEDVCADAAILEPPDGGQTLTNDKTQSITDPVLSCMWGSPSNSKGYRTVWYKVEPDYSGTLVVESAGSTYDTVLAIYRDDSDPSDPVCNILTPISCNDDNNGFTSRVSVPVRSNRTYYIEAADWQLGLQGDAVLNVAAWINVSTEWDIIANMAQPRTRHMAEVVGNDIYVIGGQVIANNNPVRSPRTDRYNTQTGIWTYLANMPGPDGFGYSNTTSAFVENKIYVPSGYIGIDGSYDDTHWVYDTIANTWTTTVTNPFWGASETPIYSAAVADQLTTVSGYWLTGGLTDTMPIPGPSASWGASRQMSFYIAPAGPWLLRPQMPIGRFGHLAALQIINGTKYLCVVGGISKDIAGDPVLPSSGHCYNTSSGQWDVTTGPLNYPRYFAASAVDPAGNWYVYGGTDGLGKSVGPTEMFDPITQSWILMDVRYDLGTSDRVDPTRPARAWPRGGFVDQFLYAIGGHRNTSSGDKIINLVEAAFVPIRRIYEPIMSHMYPAWEPFDTFATAHAMGPNFPYRYGFNSPEDYYDVFYFEVPASQNVTVRLYDMRRPDDFDLVLYDGTNGSKIWLASSRNVGALDEHIALSLGPGTYYAVVERIYPPPGSEPTAGTYVIQFQG